MIEALRHGSGLIVETRGRVRVLTLDRPERRNALSSALQADLIEELLSCTEAGDVRLPGDDALLRVCPDRTGPRRGESLPGRTDARTLITRSRQPSRGAG
jgi:hypothetical protein